MLRRLALAAAATLATVLAGGSAAAAAELVNDSRSFSVPGVGVPTAVCVTVNGQKTCNPNPATNPVTATVSALVTEGNALTVTEGAPATVASGEDCGRLAKTIDVTLAFGTRVDIQVVGTSPGINQTVNGPSVPGALAHNTIELCVNS